jgi:FAD/FMN-containing dehydrogenase
LVTASADVNPDLFWALRGGTGHNFGIAVEFVYKTVPMGEIWGFVLTWDPADAAAAIACSQDQFTGDRGLEIGYTGNITTVKNPATGRLEPVYMASGLCVEGREAGMAALAPLLATGHPIWRLDAMGHYFDMNNSVVGWLPGIPEPIQGTYEIKGGGYLVAPMPQSAWAQFFQFFVDGIKRTNPYNLVVLEIYGSAINRVGALDTAFIHRDALMNIYLDSFWHGDGTLTPYDLAQAWMDDAMVILAPYLNGHVYQNYPQRGMHDYRWQYWGDAYPSLLFVKGKFDPNNVFRYEQSITPYPDDPSVRRSSTPSRWSDPEITFGSHMATCCTGP